VDAAPPAPARHRAAFVLAGAVVVALDQLTKQLALSGLDDGPVDLIGSLQLRLTFNDGAAFNLGSGRTSAIAVLAIVVAGVLVRLGCTADRRAVAVGFGIVFGGASGNIVDRAFRAGDGFLGGHVIDFVDPQWWPVFNVADSALWVGIGVLLLATWRDGRDAPEQAGVT
jgi:signal peptidase II